MASSGATPSAAQAQIAFRSIPSPPRKGENAFEVKLTDAQGKVVAGAEVVLTEGPKGMPGAIAKAEEIVASDPKKYWMPQQFNNPANPKAHVETTAVEIWDDTGGNVDMKKKTGARGLRSIMEKVMLDVMYEIPSLANVKECVISEEVIVNHERPILIYEEEAEIA